MPNTEILRESLLFYSPFTGNFCLFRDQPAIVLGQSLWLNHPGPGRGLSFRRVAPINGRLIARLELDWISIAHGEYEMKNEFPKTSIYMLSMRCRIPILIQFACVVAGCSVSALARGDSIPDRVQFGTHVRPILTKHCTACHGGVKQAAGISFAYQDDLLGIVEPGSPDDSYVLDRITAEDESERMPPPDHGPRLGDEEVRLIRRWIEQGAQWSDHWAFEKAQRHTSPEVSDSNWCRQPMDYFVMAHLDALGVRPSIDEMPARWLRRVSLDLIGLPPTEVQLSEFLNAVASGDESAYEIAVDRLLASPQFGERWASVWFDQVRYADSRGLSEDSPRDIWKYRDWVIDAINKDLPFDQFTRKQIAGDLLPNASLEDRLATAVHRLTASNEEGGTDDEEFRVAAMVDRVNTVWQVWQGTTMGCVQCHDHPYDPIKHADYYRSMAFFNNTSDCDLTDDWPNLEVPLASSDYRQAGTLDRQIREVQQGLWDRDWDVADEKTSWSSANIKQVSSSNSTKVVIDSSGPQDRYRTTGTVARRPTITIKLAIPDGVDRLGGVRLRFLPKDPETRLEGRGSWICSVPSDGQLRGKRCR